MNTSSAEPTVSRWARLSRVIHVFSAYRLSAGLAAIFLLVALVGGCKEETPGIVNVCVSPTVTSTSPSNGASNVSLSKASGAFQSAEVAAVKLITATFSTEMDPATINTTTFTVREGSTPLVGIVSYSGTTAVFVAPNGLQPNLTYTCTITTGGTDLVGTGLAGNHVWTFTTTGPALLPPVLAAPADASINLSTSPTLSWNASTGAVTYRLQVDTTSNFATTVYNDSTITGLLQQMSGLVNGKTYFWRVNAKNANETSAYSSTWRFTVEALPPPSLLGSAETFGIMATSAITSTGNSVINGDVSLDPGTSMTGFPPAVVNGTIHINDLQSAQARNDLLSAYNSLKGLPPGTTIAPGADLGALYPLGIPPGTYTSGSTMDVATPLVLDAGGDANAVWVFQIGSSLTTGADVTLLNGAQANNVYWVPTSDATIGVGTTFNGTIVAGRDATCVTGTTINGRILAGAITAGTIALDNTVVNVP